jgi:concanavalin A-like lectin/glucanase superfamily protein/Big-like domain-containing protein
VNATIARDTATVTIRNDDVSDIAAPAIVMRTPAASATLVAPGTSVTVDFSEQMLAASFSAAVFRLRAADAVSDVPATVSITGATAALTPQSPLACGTAYDVVLAGTVTDLAGNALGSDVTWTFTTSAALTGLVAAYDLGEGSGSTAADSSGRGHTASLTNAAWTSEGRLGGAISIDGSTGWVGTPSTPALQLTSRMTVAAWVRPTALGAWRTAIMKETANGLSYALYASDGVGTAAYVNLGAGDIGLAGPAIPMNTWTYLAVTFDGQCLSLFINGAEVSSRPAAGNLVVSTGALRIGGNAVWGEHFAGEIDEVRIYDRPLTAAEIQLQMITPIR